MPNRKTLSRLALAGMVAALVAAPTASAMQTDPQGTDAAVQDVRGEAAASGGGTTANDTTAPLQELRGEAAAGGGGTGAGASGGPVRAPRVQPAPTWPAYPTPLPRPAQQPMATDGGDDIGVDLPVALLILAGTLAVGGLAVVAMKGRTQTPAAH